MTTREEQIEKAQEFARLNPDWTLYDRSYTTTLSRDGGMSEVELTSTGFWWARNHSRGALRNERGYLNYYASPFSAARALGFDVKEEG